MSSASTTRALHLAPSRLSNDTFFIPLIRDASTWGGDLCLHLQPYPIPWIFVVTEEEENEEDSTTSNVPTSLDISEPVLQELLSLFQNLQRQGRKLHLILEKDFIQDSSILQRLLAGLAPLLIRIETNHSLLFHLLPNMTTSCPHLTTLIMDLSTSLCRQTLTALITLLQDPHCRLKGLHLHNSIGFRGLEQLVSMKELFAELRDCILQSRSIESLKLSGRLDYVTSALTLSDWLSEAMTNFSISLRKLELESNNAQLHVVTNSETNFLYKSNNHVQISSKALLNFFKLIASSSITHLTIRMKSIEFHATSGYYFSSPSWSCLTGIVVASSLTHLTLQAGLTTPMVDNLLVELQHATPNLQELDLEGNDMESLQLPVFLQDQKNRFHYLERLLLGSNLFVYSTQMEWVEELLQACPRLDVGHRGGMPSCGIFDANENEWTGQRRTLFTSWAHGTSRALALKDWNRYGRYLILESCFGGLWPFVLEQVTRQLHQLPIREATLLYWFLQSGAIPGVCMF